MPINRSYRDRSEPERLDNGSVHKHRNERFNKDRYRSRSPSRGDGIAVTPTVAPAATVMIHQAAQSGVRTSASLTSDGSIDMFAVDDESDTKSLPGFAATSDVADAVKVQPTAKDKLDLLKTSDRPIESLRDEKGYFVVELREILGKRFEVLQRLGAGNYSSVIRAWDHVNEEEVAIKIIRKDEMMEEMAQVEARHVMELNAADPYNKRHVIRFKDQFKHQTHLCLVYENMAKSLREIMLQYSAGINLKAVRGYGVQLLKALVLLQDCGLLHCDLKPDNILIDENHTQMKVADLGSAYKAETMPEGLPFLASRFYRAPEIMLGLRGEYAMDMWSAGCLLYELATGRFLYDGATNNEMLDQMQTMRGRVPRWMLQEGQKRAIKDPSFDVQVTKHFAIVKGDFIFKKLAINDENGILIRTKEYPNQVPKDSSLRSRVVKNVDTTGAGLKGVQGKELLADLLDKMLLLDPKKRIDAKTALQHKFFIGNWHVDG